MNSVYSRDIGVGKDADLLERVKLKKADRNELYTLEPTFPKTNFLIEVSNACNHACIFCTHQKMKRSIGKINKEFCFDILQQAYDLGTREVGFYATGEPFLVNDIDEYIKKAKDIGYTYVYLTSNGALATPDRISKVIDAGLDSIKFSINAPNRKLYKFIHNKDDFDAVYDNLVYLNKYREKSGKNYKIYVTGILTKFTEGLVDRFHDVFDDISDQVVFKYVYNQGGYMPEIEEYLRCDCDDEVKRVCNLPFDAISVTKEGYLSVENADYENMLIVADLNKVSLYDGWYGDNMKKVRKMFINNSLEGTICDGCVNHKCIPGRALDEKYSTVKGEYEFNSTLVKERIDNSDLRTVLYINSDIKNENIKKAIDKAVGYGKTEIFVDDNFRTNAEENGGSMFNHKNIIDKSAGNLDSFYELLFRKRYDFVVLDKESVVQQNSSLINDIQNKINEWDGQIVYFTN